MPPLPLLENAPTVLGAARGAVRQSDADLKAESAVSMGRHILAGGGALASARGALEPTLPAEEVAVSKRFRAQRTRRTRRPPSQPWGYDDFL